MNKKYSNTPSNSTDSLIDTLVYQLYGLTEADIKKEEYLYELINNQSRSRSRCCH